jgi:hypothetical protein
MGTVVRYVDSFRDPESFNGERRTSVGPRCRQQFPEFDLRAPQLGPYTLVLVLALGVQLSAGQGHVPL